MNQKKKPIITGIMYIICFACAFCSIPLSLLLIHERANIDTTSTMGSR